MLAALRGVGEREFYRRLMPAAEARPGGRAKKRKPRQEISACLKWIVFLFNFLVFLVGVAILALGVYLFIKDYSEVKLVDIVLNPAILIGIIGFIICIISLFGSLGALRDNIFLLKCFALCVFFCYIVIVIATFLLFVLFYSESTEGISAHSVMLYAVRNYHTNRNLAEIVDSLQENLQCCGVSSVAQGYRDWNMSYQFNCTPSNPQPEKCGVPYSCCRKSVISEAAGSSNPLLPAMRSLECWRNALSKRPQDLEHDIYTRGCLQPLRTLFETHAVHIGAIVAVIIIPVCFSVCFTNVLAKQIDHQRYLLEREARRNERYRKRERDRHRRVREATVDQMEQGRLATYDASIPPKLPDHPPPSKPPNREKRKELRVASCSPTRAVVSTVPTAPQDSKSSRPMDEASAPAKKRERRSRSSAATGASAVVADPKSKSDARVRQWVLQQSDLMKPSATTPTAPNVAGNTNANSNPNPNAKIHTS